MRLGNFKAKNFLSFEYLEYEFKPHPIRVQGINKTDKGQANNGSGKSAMFHGIELCWTGSTNRKASLKELVRRGCDKSELYSTIICDIRKKILHIERTIGKDASLEIYETDLDGNDKEHLSFSTTLDGNKCILNWMDIDKEDLSSYYLVNQDGFKSFFSSSNTKKLELINRFSDTDMVIEAIDDVKKKVEELQDELKTLHGDKYRIEGRIEETLSQIAEEEEKDFSLEKQEKIDYHNSIISGAKREQEENLDQISDINKAILSIKSDIKSKSSSLNALKKKIDEKGIDALEKDLVDMEDGFDDAQEQLTKEKSKKSKLNVLLGGAVECPSCHTEFIPESDIEKTTDSLNICEESIGEIVSIKNEIEGVLESIGKDLKKSKLVQKEVLAIERDLDRLGSDTERQQNRVLRKTNQNEDIDQRILSAKESIKLIEKSKEDLSTLKSLKSRLKSAKVELKEVNEKIEIKDTEIFNTEQWETNFKRFRLDISGRALKVIQGICNNILSGMDTDMRIRIDGFKELGSGKLKEEIGTKILRDDEENNIGSYSKGELGRLELSMILALKQIIDGNNKWGGLDFLSLDEVLGGLDSLGFKLVMDSIKDMKKTIFLISHVSDENLVGDNVMTIEKVDNKSKIR